jgi:DNA-3-methyladenine glycosylase
MKPKFIRKQAILNADFYAHDTVTVARALLGTFLIHESSQGITAGRIVETEAYLYKIDPASHAFRGQTPRNAAMFGPPGRAYIYFVYGMHYCFNVVTGGPGIGEAALIRALEPVAGIPLMEQRRGTNVLKNLCSGPGKLVQALGLTREHNGWPLTRGAVTIRSSFLDEDNKAFEIETSARIGITAAAELPLRFFIKGNKFVSK